MRGRVCPSETNDGHRGHHSLLIGPKAPTCTSLACRGGEHSCPRPHTLPWRGRPRQKENADLWPTAPNPKASGAPPRSYGDGHPGRSRGADRRVAPDCAGLANNRHPWGRRSPIAVRPKRQRPNQPPLRLAGEGISPREPNRVLPGTILTAPAGKPTLAGLRRRPRHCLVPLRRVMAAEGA